MTTSVLDRPRTSVVDRVLALDRLMQSQDADRLRMSDRSATNSTLGGNMQRSILLPSNPYKMRVWINNGNVTNPGTLPFDTVSYDTAGGFNATTHAYTVPVDGYYQINAVTIAQTPAAAQNWATQLFIQTGAIIAQGPISSATSGGIGTTIGANLNDIYFFNKGDVLTVAVAYSIAPLGVGAQGGNWNFGNVQSYGEYWSMQLISV